MAAQLALILLAVAAGMTAPVQAGINVHLRSYLHSAYAASFTSFVIGTLALAGLLLLRRETVPFGAAFAQAPWWVWSGGFIGAFFVTVSIVVAPRLGAATMMALFVTGQMIAGLVLDHYGLIGFQQNSATPLRILGAALLIAGVILIRGF